MESSLFNCTAGTNSCKIFDPFCNTMTTGPLVMSVIALPLLCLGIPCSTRLFWVLAQRQLSGLANDAYMFNLTLMDLLYNIFKVPSFLNYFIWQKKELMMLTIFMEGLSINGRPLFMANVCVECFVAVIFPVAYVRAKQSRYRLIVCACVWIFIFVYQLTVTLIDRVLLLPIWGIIRIVAISVIVFCDLAIIHALRKPDPTGKTYIHPQKQRALQTITNSLAMTLLSYVCPLFLYVASPFLHLSRQEEFCKVNTPSLIFSVLGSTIMPLLYLGNLGKLKNFTGLKGSKA